MCNTNLNAARWACDDALAMTWDGCHKIYLLMDEKTVEEYKHDPERWEQMRKPDFDAMEDWYDASCALRFVATSAYGPDGDKVIEHIVGQGAG